MRYLGANALLRIGFSLGMGMPASAAIPLPDLALALQEAKHSISCHRSCPGERLRSITLAGIKRAMRPTTLRNSPIGRWLTAIT